jgi:hypothetical protein
VRMLATMAATTRTTTKEKWVRLIGGGQFTVSAEN